MSLDERGGGPPKAQDDLGADSAQGRRTVRIHIDREPYETDTPTTGAALYALAGIDPKFELFREAVGDVEDEFIARDNAAIRLTLDEHFYSQKDYRIIVNARARRSITAPG